MDSLRTDLDAHLDPTAGRGCEVALVAGPRPTVVFRAHHAVMDGRGLLSWASDVFRALRGEEPVGAPSPLYDLALLGELTDSSGVARRERQMANWRSPLARWGSGTGRGADRCAAHWVRRTVDGAYPGLVAKTAAAIADFSGAATRVMVPVDLRRHRPDLRSTANLSLPVFVEGRPGEPWEAWHERLLQALVDGRELAAGEETALARLPLGVLGPLLRATDRATSALGRYPCSALVSHLGRIEPKDLRAPGFEAETAYSLPVQVPFTPVSFTALEFGSHTQLVMSHPGRLRGDTRGADALLATVCEVLSPAARRGPLTAGPQRTEEPATLTAMLRRQIERTPDAVALIGREGPISYAELDRRSDVVAAALRARGAGRGAVVGLLADRSVAALAGLWGALKAGAAYLPLDPNHPPARIAAVLADAGAALCLVGEEHKALPGHDVPVLVLDRLPTDGAEPAPETTLPDDVAYVIYTSGSTGRPKGVLVEHRALVEYTHWATDRYGVDASTRFGLFTSLAFDLTGTAIFPPLLAGGSIALVPGEAGRHNLTELLTQLGVNALKLTPAHLELICALDVGPQNFRVLVVGGEQLRGPVAAQAQLVFGPGCRVVNEYGPTEATIGCVIHTFDPQCDADSPAVPIGVPVDNTQVYLLDASGRPAAPGEAGEVHLAGAQLARGYLHRPELDRERFFLLADGTRVYRTGDLARLSERGVLEFLGRVDDQLSIRGHRIEPGEVEAVLEQHPEVARAIVLGRPGRPDGEPVLCAYVSGTAEPDAVREHAARLLPSYLVPASVRLVEAFPQTVNGKIDVQALPEPFDDAQVAVRDDRPQRAFLELAVAEIWSQVLGTADLPIRPSDNFHHLGGDSLTLLIMLSQVADKLVGQTGGEVFQRALRDIIRAPTLERVCLAVREATDPDTAVEDTTEPHRPKDRT
ncbi:non-ribosomal peptide synthetase [Streptomyces sp. NPDC002730]|uniref:non-ribosomal peptide synthetase n=1 Tax=Streptomyces sp. NPDC002730 TaxID=3364662 RepID=UPI0036B679A1